MKDSPVPHPWSVEAEDVLSQLQADSDQGLSQSEAGKRLQEYGPNRPVEKQAKPALTIFVEQWKNLIVGMLAAAALVSFGFGQALEGVAICMALLVNVAIGFFTELRATRSMEALVEITKTESLVLRDGHQQSILSDNLVPGDVVPLEAGDVPAADMRLIEVSNMEVDESALTGESLPVPKQTEPVDTHAVLGDRSSMLFKGTALTAGTGAAVVTGTGMQTELGRIAQLAEEAESEQTPLERRLEAMGKKLLWVTIVLAAMVAAIGVSSGMELFLIIETSIALAVAAIPEGLPIVANIALAKGMFRLARENAVMQQLSAVETLGAASVICTDKTGTLTENCMRLTRIALPGDGAPFEEDLDQAKDDGRARELLRVAALCVNAQLHPEGGDPVGDPLEIALLEGAASAGMERPDMLEHYPEEREEAFAADTKMMATFHKDGGEGYLVQVKGAPESVFEVCNISDEERQTWRKTNESLAGQGLRILAAAQGRAKSLDDDPYYNLSIVGLLALRDPVRKGMVEAVQACHKAGIRVVMVTGDQAATALHVAHELHITEDAADRALHGRDFKDPETMNREEKDRILNTRVFCRVSPEQKLQLVKLLQAEGLVIAMTGDGVNDAPALKKADIGVAMGKRGTQVARDAAHLVLRDDSFSTIIAAVEQGRAIFDNIRKFIVYLLSGNVGAIVIVGTAIPAGIGLPLLPLQILYLNMLSDVFPALALGVGQGDKSVMLQPPRPSSEPILDRERWIQVIGYGLLIAATVLASFWWARIWLGLSGNAAVTISFLTLAFARQWHVFNMRAPESNILFNGVTRNKFVWGALAICFFMLFLAIYTPPLAHALHLTPPTVAGWTAIVGFSLIPLVVGQAIIILRKKGRKG